MNRLDVPPAFTALLEGAAAEAERSGEPTWSLALRREAMATLTENGFPTTRVETWKYTNIRPLIELAFSLPAPTEVPDVADLLPRRLEDECEIIVVDGKLAPEHSRHTAVPGLEVATFADGMRNGLGATLQARLSTPQPGDDGAFVALNRALCTGGLYLRVARNAVLDRRVHVLFLTTGRQPRMLTAPRVLIDVEAGAEARFVQSHIGHPGTVSFTNAVTDLQVGAQSRVLFVKVQAEAPDAFHYGAVRARQAADSTLTLFDFTVGGKLARHDLCTALEGEGATVHLDGLTALKDRQHVDHHTCVDHRVPRGTSRQRYKAILDDHARVVFNGRVVVQPGAKLTDGYQLNQNLLLSRNAVVNTQPQLEIANDDVKCTHGATIGQLDEDQLFYLQTRGIAPPDAVGMLSRGFVEDVLFLLKDKPLQDKLRAVLHGYFTR